MRARDAGFTLVEMTVVVGVIGLLAAIAIPSYQSYQTRARQAEAKIALASIHAVEQTFFTEYGTYSSCIKKLGYTGDENPKRYYFVGFNTGTATNAQCGVTGSVACNTYTYLGTAAGATCANSDGQVAFAATTKVNSSWTHTGSASVLNPTPINQNAYTAMAGGNVSTSNLTDKWTINQDKILFNSQQGI